MDFKRVTYPGLELCFERDLPIDEVTIGVTLLPPGIEITWPLMISLPSA